MKYRLLGYREEKGRTILVVEKKTLGIFKSTVECIDSYKEYSLAEETVWFYYPSFEKIGAFSKLQKFCESCMRKIEHDKK